MTRTKVVAGDMTTDAGKQWVEDVEALIATERAKL